jgi:uncharacterized membrane protein YkvA (DUF1232 family)
VPDLPGWAYGLVVVILLYAAFLLVLIATGRRGAALEAALFLPNLIRLFRGLLGDPEVPWHAKAALGGGLVYLASPIDLVPDFIPVAGHLDDAIVAALILGYVVRVSGRPAVERHWRGDPAILRRLLRG